MPEMLIRILKYAVSASISVHDKITASLVGRVIAAEEEEKPAVLNSIYILIFLVVILIIFNIVIYFRKIKK